MTNLDQLHLVHESIGVFGSIQRRYGKTVYFCHCVAGYLEVLQHETIIVILPYIRRENHFIHTLEDILHEHDIHIKKIDYSSHRIFFNNNSNNVKIMSLDSISRMRPGDAGASHNQYPIIDLDDMPGRFFNEDFTIGNIHMLDKYYDNVQPPPGCREAAMKESYELFSQYVDNKTKLF